MDLEEGPVLPKSYKPKIKKLKESINKNKQYLRRLRNKLEFSI